MSTLFSGKSPVSDSDCTICVTTLMEYMVPSQVIALLPLNSIVLTPVEGWVPNPL